MKIKSYRIVIFITRVGYYAELVYPNEGEEE